MALLIEANRIIIKLSAIDNTYQGGLDEFKYRILSEVVYKDDDLLVIEFMNRGYSDLSLDIMLDKGITKNEVASIS